MTKNSKDILGQKLMASIIQPIYGTGGWMCR
jgi:hypothetical protein